MTEPTAVQRENRALGSDLRQRLDKEPLVRALSRYEVAVLDGCATLVGHVRSRQVARTMVAAAGRVNGIATVAEQLVADDELELQVASAIGRSPLNRLSRLVIRAEFGHVRIGGVYPSPEARADAMRVGGEVVGVLSATPTRASDILSS